MSAAARARGIWTNAADQPVDCEFILPAIARSGRVTVAVSTDGASPALAKALRDRIAHDVGRRRGRTRRGVGRGAGGGQGRRRIHRGRRLVGHDRARAGPTSTPNESTPDCSPDDASRRSRADDGTQWVAIALCGAVLVSCSITRRRRRAAQRPDPVRRRTDEPTTDGPTPPIRRRRPIDSGRPSAPTPTSPRSPRPTRPGCPRSAMPDAEIVEGTLDNGLRYIVRSNDNPGRPRVDAPGDRRRFGRRDRRPGRRGPLPRTHAVQRHRGVPGERARRHAAQLRGELRRRRERVHELRRDGLRADDAHAGPDRGRHRAADPRTVAGGGHARPGAGRGRARRGARRVARVGDERRAAGSSTSSSRCCSTASPYEGRDPIGTDDGDQRDDPRAAGGVLRHLVPARTTRRSSWSATSTRPRSSRGSRPSSARSPPKVRCPTDQPCGRSRRPRSRRRCSPIPTWRRGSRRSISRWSRRAPTIPMTVEAPNAAGDPRHARLRHRRDAARQCRAARRCAVRRRRPSIRARSCAGSTHPRSWCPVTAPTSRRRRNGCSTSSNGSAATGSPTPRSTGRPRRPRPMPTPIHAGRDSRQDSDFADQYVDTRSLGTAVPTADDEYDLVTAVIDGATPATVAYGLVERLDTCGRADPHRRADRGGRGRARRVGVRRPGGDRARSRHRSARGRRGDRGFADGGARAGRGDLGGAARRGGRRRIHRAGAGRVRQRRAGVAEHHTDRRRRDRVRGPEPRWDRPCWTTPTCPPPTPPRR